MVKPIRRVVTGHDDRGRAVVVSDGPAPSVHINKAEQDWFSVDIWRTHEMPAKIVPKAVEEPTAGPRRQMPTTNGTVLRINSFPPESEAVRTMTPADSLRVFEGLGNPKAATFGKGGRHPMMHRTESIDYALILSGEITAARRRGGAEGRRCCRAVRHQSCLEQSLQCALPRRLHPDRRRIRPSTRNQVRNLHLRRTGLLRHHRHSRE